jgi:energy-coupling factor transporter ATP-binding protein EcfA2
MWARYLNPPLPLPCAQVGPNGAGKSTLLKLMLQEIEPQEGEVRRNPHLRIGRYNQHSEDVLDLNATPLDFMQVCVWGTKEEGSGRLFSDRAVQAPYGLVKDLTPLLFPSPPPLHRLSSPTGWSPPRATRRWRSRTGGPSWASSE